MTKAFENSKSFKKLTDKLFMNWLTKIFPISVLLSVLLHMLVMGGIHWTDKKAIQTQKMVEIEYISIEDKSEQIVEQDQRKNDKTPTEESFLGKFDQSFDEQMRAAKSGKTKDTNAGGNFIASPKKLAPPVLEKDKLTGKKVDWKDVSLSDLKPKLNFEPEKEQNQAAFVGEESQSSDYLETIKRGNQNLLSTREFKFYTYFSRIRTQLQQYWEPSIQAKLYKLLRSGRSIASAGPKTTKVLITLNNLGALVSVQVLEDSGVRDLDEAAVEAFQKAAPFPNPPQGIVDKQGEVKIRWDFVLEA